MFRIGLKMLIGDRAKYITLVSGLSFVVLLFVQQGSVFCGLMVRTAKPVEAVGAPIWVCDPNLQSIDDSKPMIDTELGRVRSVPGVKWAVPLFIRQVQVRLKDGKFQTVRLFGLDNSSLIGRPSVMLEGDPAALNAPDAVILGKAESDRLGINGQFPKIGDTFELNDRLARVVGIADVPRDFLSNPYVFTTYDRAILYAPRQRKQLNFILAAPQDGVPVEQALQNIRKTTGLGAFSQEGMQWLTIGYYMKNTGIPINIGISLTLVFVVGMAIAGQTFYAFALQNERYFGALKAMGTRSRTLVGMIILQSVTVGLIGYGIGAGAATFIGWLGRNGRLAFYTPYQLLIISFGVTMFICLLSSLVSIQRVLRLEPAVVFRG
ncbi:MAG: ABC transporter permease [Blastocatellia bacterium]|nr:ABC transporter permease [Blastocatellia bacterium]